MSEPIQAQVTAIGEFMNAKIAELQTSLTAATKRAEAAEAECDALRKDAEMLREAIDIFISFQGSTREPEGQAALNAALAVQP